MTKRILTFFVAIALFSLNLKSQADENTAFKGGEELKFVASYFMSGLWTDLAEVKMSVEAVKVNNTNLYRIVNTARTYAQWDSYFKIRDSYQSWVHPTTLIPYIYKRDIYEGGFALKIDYTFKRKSLVATSKMVKGQDNPIVQDVKITSGTLDLASVLFNVRKIDFSKEAVGTNHYFTVLIDNELVTIGVRYAGKETIDVGKYGKKVCYKVGAFLKEEKIMKNNPTNNIWFTADANKVPVLLKAVIPVGNIQIRLVEMTGLRN